MDLRGLGQDTARKATFTGRLCSGKRDAKQIRRGLKRIEKARQRLCQKSWERIPAAVEWLLDNAYLSRREGMSAQEELKRGKRLRVTDCGSYLQVVALTFAEASPTAKKEDLACFLRGVQEERPLTEEELSLFLSALKGALCLRLAELCSDVELFPEKAGLSETMEGIFTGLRILSTANFGPLIEQSSPVEQILQMDPAELYPKMDEVTRARYRQQVCLLARRHGLEEKETAEKALSLAQEGQGQEGGGGGLGSRGRGRR